MLPRRMASVVRALGAAFSWHFAQDTDRRSVSRCRPLLTDNQGKNWGKNIVIDSA